MLAWLITTTTVVAAVFAWGQNLGWNPALLHIYTIFPVFGLIAFSTMWSQYLATVLLKLTGAGSSALNAYYNYTGKLVLAAILLHPGLLIWQLWRDNFGLPPVSYIKYVSAGAAWLVILSTICFLIFIAFEFKRWFGGKPWWKIVNYAADLAVVGIFIHSLKLGSHTQTGWFHYLWLFYGTSLIASLFYLYALKIANKRKA